MSATHFIDVSYEEEAYRSEADEQKVLSILTKTLDLLDQGSCELSVSFVSDETMQGLNKEYRDKDEPTDILSFAQQDEVEDFSWPEVQYEGEESLPEEVEVLGDMVISLDTLKRNAQSFSVEEEEELTRLLIHGLLHLLGEDHESNDVHEPMLVKQEQLLNQVRGSKR